MILVVLLIGAVLIVSAVRNTYGALFTALGSDVPAYVVWAAAIVALGAIGFVPGLKPVSRGLLALVLIVIILRNYAAILVGFKSVDTVSSAAATTTTAGTSTTTTAPATSSTVTPSATTTGTGMVPYDPAIDGVEVAPQTGSTPVGGLSGLAWPTMGAFSSASAGGING